MRSSLAPGGAAPYPSRGASPGHSAAALKVSGGEAASFLALGRAAAGRAHAASRPQASSQATGGIMPQAERIQYRPALIYQ